MLNVNNCKTSPMMEVSAVAAMLGGAYKKIYKTQKVPLGVKIYSTSRFKRAPRVCLGQGRFSEARTQSLFYFK